MLSSWKTDSNGATPPNHGEQAKMPTTPPPIQPGRTITGKAKSLSQSIVDECLTMRGDLESEADILVKGKVFGNIKCKVLIIDAGATVEGGIEADEAIIRGKYKGIVNAARVRLEQSANVEGDLYQDSFSAEEGARIRGSLKSREELSAEKSAKPVKDLGPVVMGDKKLS